MQQNKTWSDVTEVPNIKDVYNCYLLHYAVTGFIIDIWTLGIDMVIDFRTMARNCILITACSYNNQEDWSNADLLMYYCSATSLQGL